VTERTRVLSAGAVGTIFGASCAAAVPWQLAALVGWVAAAFTLVAWIWLTVWNVEGKEVQAIATREDDSRAAARAVVLGASVASLLGVVLGLLKANELGGWWKGALTTAAILTVVASWFAIHTMFAMRYAHLYFGGPGGGVDFAGEEHPDYRDFGYLAFTVGMTFQVSDTAISSRSIRRTVTRHALLSYLFGTVIVALLINVTAGLIR
jgi:uncharacterized membrane protein